MNEEYKKGYQDGFADGYERARKNESNGLKMSTDVVDYCPVCNRDRKYMRSSGQACYRIADCPEIGNMLNSMNSTRVGGGAYIGAVGSE